MGRNDCKPSTVCQYIQGLRIIIFIDSYVTVSCKLKADYVGEEEIKNSSVLAAS